MSREASEHRTGVVNAAEKYPPAALLAATPNWFRSNWSLAHELGHLALRHHDNGAPTDAAEAAANAFAAELLMPSETMRAQSWQTMTIDDVAKFLWTTGVSAPALHTRLSSLRIELANSPVAATSAQRTPHLLRGIISGAEIAERQQAASARRLPLGLLAELEVGVESGRAHPEALAWALDTDVDDIDFPEPDETASAGAYANMLSGRAGLNEVGAGIPPPDVSAVQDWRVANCGISG